jgi:hypothetical protein
MVIMEEDKNDKIFSDIESSAGDVDNKPLLVDGDRKYLINDMHSGVLG